MAGINNEIVYGSNVDFSGSAVIAARLNTNGQMLIGSTVPNAGGTTINVGTIVSPLGTISVGYTNPNITIDITGGANAIEKIAVDTNVAPGTNPVVPSAGIITVTGAQVAAGTIGANVIRTDSLAANTYTIQVQRSTAVASTASVNNGVSHFDSAKFLVDANAFVTTVLGNVQGSTNLGIAQSAGTTFTVQSASGAALSATNPAYVTLQSLANPGRLITYAVTANQSFTQANISANTWGLTSGVNWASDMPFYLYAVSNAQNGENTISFMISRIPNRALSPVAGNIAKSGSAVATTQGSFYSLANITVADYASSPCICLGSFRMQYAASGTNWTIQTLNDLDGIGQFNESTNFSFTVSQNGNATGSFYAANGGTAPIWNNQTANYYMDRSGNIRYIVDTPTGSTVSQNGVGAVNLLANLPLAYKSGSLQENLGFYSTTTPTGYFLYTRNPVVGTLTTTGFTTSNPIATSLLQNADVTSAAGVLLLWKMGYIADLG